MPLPAPPTRSPIRTPGRARARRWAVRLAPLALLLLAGCDQLGIESASQQAARREADGKAIGAGCRHAARSIEDCYARNRRADRAAVFAGWREMNDYMLENKMEPMPPPPPAAAEADGEAEPEQAARSNAADGDAVARR